VERRKSRDPFPYFANQRLGKYTRDTRDIRAGKPTEISSELKRNIADGDVTAAPRNIVEEAATEQQWKSSHRVGNWKLVCRERRA
jgi:hypothetical protein